ncbi:MAG: SGNH/GDSL hydrolase family protein [Ruminococcaceae bacterium]|nr:SGNH/GDSL hydrolase family protein [Oscillospiraceae bacterium]
MKELKGKTIIWNGDSICAGSPVWGNWATRIAEKNDTAFHNYAVGGGTITENAPCHVASGAKRHSVSATLEKMQEEYPNADYVIFEGGANDADLLGTNRLGVITSGFEDTFDRETFCGALESLFYRALSYWKGKKIGFVIAQKMGMEPYKYEARILYFEHVRKICTKWGIPCLDLWNGCYLNPFLPWMYDSTKSVEENRTENTGYYLDGQHLTPLGYDVTTELIDAWLKML